MKYGEAGSVLSRLAEHTLAVDAHPAFLWYWNVAVRAAVPAFGYLAINKSGVGVDVEANLPPRRGYTHKPRPRVGCADIQMCFYGGVSLKAHRPSGPSPIGRRLSNPRLKVFPLLPKGQIRTVFFMPLNLPEALQRVTQLGFDFPATCDKSCSWGQEIRNS